MSGMRDQDEAPVLNPAEERPASASRRTGAGPIVIGLMVTATIAVVGGVYLALQRVPAAPPRTQQIGSSRATLETDPRVPWSGPAELIISIVDAGGIPVTDAEVTLTYKMEIDGSGRRMPGMGEPGRATAHMEAPGRYTAPVRFTMAGQWAFWVAIARDGRREGQGVFHVTVR